MGTWLRLAALVPLALWGPALAAAQAPAALPPPVTLSHAEGRVDVARASGVAPAQAPDLLDDGDGLLTADGRAELVFADGSLVHVDRDSDVHIENGARLRLVRGRVLVRTTPASSPLDLATPVGVVRFAPRGDYEIAVRDLDGATVIAARTGHATLTQADRDVPIAADDELWLDPRGGEPRWTRVGTRRDAFIDWAEARVAEMRTSSSSQPLPVELTAYAPALEEYGQWDTLPVYGAAWFPRVGVGWRPYAHGSWRHTRHGWTWIDQHRWGWPVHHYGRWGRHPSRGWYWMPHRTWGPAWVGWAVQADYVGWAPLGWNSMPVVDFFVGGRVGPVDAWAGCWSVIPRGAFGLHGPVGPYFADLRHLPGPVLGGFVQQRHSPRGPGGWAPGPRPRTSGAGARIAERRSRDGCRRRLGAPGSRTARRPARAARSAVGHRRGAGATPRRSNAGRRGPCRSDVSRARRWQRFQAR